MTRLTRTLLIAGVVSTGLPAAVLAQAPFLPAGIGDLSAGKVIEIRDGTGTAVLCAPLEKKPVEGNEHESEGKLIGCGSDTKAKGESEVEVKKTEKGLEQEVELTVAGLAPDTRYSIYVDTTQVGTFQTDKTGAAEIELKSAPAAAAKK